MHQFNLLQVHKSTIKSNLLQVQKTVRSRQPKCSSSSLMAAVWKFHSEEEENLISASITSWIMVLVPIEYQVIFQYDCWRNNFSAKSSSSFQFSCLKFQPFRMSRFNYSTLRSDIPIWFRRVSVCYFIDNSCMFDYSEYSQILICNSWWVSCGGSLFFSLD